MSRINEFMSKLADSKSAVVVLSGGMDSAVAARLAVERYGSDNVHALTYYYQQKQSIEIDRARTLALKLSLKSHFVLDIGFLGDISRGISANIRGGQPMPTIRDVLGDPTPSTYVPNRNAILLMIAASYAESNGISTVVTGLQSQDQYGYHDTTPEFVDSINRVLAHARVRMVQVSAPFLSTNKAEEILLLNELDGHINLLADTLTCYDPDDDGVSCGVCPSCAERIANFVRAGFRDLIPYSKEIPWKSLLTK